MGDTYIISGKQGAGKTTLVNNLVNYTGFKIIPTFTTREKRIDIIEKDYIYVSNNIFDKLIELNILLEYQSFYSGGKRKRYGTSKYLYQTNDNNIRLISCDLRRALDILCKINTSKLIYLEASEEIRRNRILHRTNYFTERAIDEDKEYNLLLNVINTTYKNRFIIISTNNMNEKDLTKYVYNRMVNKYEV